MRKVLVDDAYTSSQCLDCSCRFAVVRQPAGHLGALGGSAQLRRPTVTAVLRRTVCARYVQLHGLRSVYGGTARDLCPAGRGNVSHSVCRAVRTTRDSGETSCFPGRAGLLCRRHRGDGAERVRRGLLHVEPWAGVLRRRPRRARTWARPGRARRHCVRSVPTPRARELAACTEAPAGSFVANIGSAEPSLCAKRHVPAEHRTIIVLRGSRRHLRRQHRGDHLYRVCRRDLQRRPWCVGLLPSAGG